MSTFLCDHNHINYLVNAAMPRALDPDSSWGPYWDLGHSAGGMISCELRAGDFAAAVKLGNMLWEENRLSVQATYAPVTLDRKEYRFRMLKWPLSPIQVIKAANCYEYQACESPDWRRSQARAFVHALVWFAIQCLPEYQAAPWGAPVPTARAIPTRPPLARKGRSPCAL